MTEPRTCRTCGASLAFRHAKAAYCSQRCRRPAAQEYARQYARRLRGAVFDHYGWACACCGATGRLSIDHVNGGGAAHRRELFGRDIGGGLRFYRWLASQRFPAGYQTLCMPCNSNKGERGACRLDHAQLAAVGR